MTDMKLLGVNLFYLPKRPTLMGAMFSFSFSVNSINELFSYKVIDLPTYLFCFLTQIQVRPIAYTINSKNTYLIWKIG